MGGGRRPALADTVQARCDGYPKGEARAGDILRSVHRLPASGCRRQGFVGIQFRIGKRHDLSPNERQPDGCTDRNGRAVTRELLEDNRGQVYRFKEKSIFVDWDNAPCAP